MESTAFARLVEQAAVQALLYEVSATPKPGLVDRNNNGAHRDMDFYTFLRSAAALGQSFHACALTGAEHAGTPQALLPKLREIGLSGEERMYQASGGVNTHKGILFSMGMLCGAAGLLHRRGMRTDAESVCDEAARIVEGIVERDFRDIYRKENLTYGERLFRDFGITGIRGEVAAGFPTLRHKALETVRSGCGTGGDTNTALVQALLQLMTEAEDSNVLGRHDPAMLEAVRHRAGQVLEAGGAFTPKGMDAVEAFDRWCIRNWVSPGGAADLLAAAVFLVILEKTSAAG